MKKECMDRVAQALGRPVTPNEYADLERRIERSARYLAQSDPAYRRRSEQERMLLAADHAAAALSESAQPVAKGTRGPMASRDDRFDDRFDPYAAPDPYINLNRISGPDAFREYVKELSQDSAKQAYEAVGRRRTLEQVERDAARENAWAALMRRRKGDILGDAEMLALRNLRDASAAKVRELAAAYDESPSRAAKYALGRSLNLHRAIQAEVSGASADAARLLGSLRTLSGSSDAISRQIDDAIARWGTNENVDALIKRINQLGANQEFELDELVRIGWRQKASDIGGTWLRAMFLSNPKTHFVNAAGNFAVMGLDIGSTYMGGVLGRDAAMMKEAMVKSEAFMDAIVHQWRYMAKHSQLSPAKPGFSLRFDSEGVSGRQVDAEDPGQRAISADAFGLDSSTPLGRMIDILGYGLSAPSEALGTADDMFKGINYRAEMRAMAFAQAQTEIADGRITQDQLGQRMQELLDFPDESMIAEASRAAKERTFTSDPGPATMAVLNLRRQMNMVTGLPVGHFLLPFVITPSNIFSYTFRHLPTAAFFPEWRAEYEAGGRRRHRAVGQVAMGTSVLMLGIALAQMGVLTGSGPDDREDRRELMANQGLGWQPFSVRTGSHTFTVDRLDPVSSLLLIGAEINEIYANKTWSDEPDEHLGEVLMGSALAIGRLMLEKSYLTGVRDFLKAIDDENFAQSYANRTAAAVTTPSVVAEVRRQQDPFWREADTLLAAIKNRLPGSSSTLPKEYDAMGRPKVYQSGLGVVYDSAMPFIAKKIDPEPIDEELMRLRYLPSPMDRVIGVSVAGQRVPVNLREHPEIYSRMTELMGGSEEYGIPPIISVLNELVESPGYASLMDGSSPLEGSKARAIRDVFSQYREMSREIVANREYYSDLQDLGRQEMLRMAERAREQEGAEGSALTQGILDALQAQ